MLGSVEKISVCARQCIGDDVLRLGKDVVEMILIAKAFSIDLVDIFRTRRAGREPAIVGDNLDPAKALPLAGAVVRIWRIVSPASSVELTLSADRRDNCFFCAGVAAASIRPLKGRPSCCVSSV